MEPLLAIGRKAMEVGTILAFVFGVGWYIAEPRAQEFIQEAVKDRLQTLEQSADEIKKQQREQDLSNIRTESDLSTVKSQQREMQEDLKVIIQKLINE